MRGMDRLQKMLYLVIAVLGIYILYKSGQILAKTPAFMQIFDAGEVQRSLEDSAMRTWAPGYTATVEGSGGRSGASGWMRQLVPAYSYLAEGQAETAEREADTEDTEAETDTTQYAVKTDAGQTTADSSGKNPQEAAAQTDTPETAPEQENEIKSEVSQASSQNIVSDVLLEQLTDFNYLLTNYYTVDAGTSANAALLDAEALLSEDLRIEKKADEPQILIYHTHSQEAFADSQAGNEAHTIVGMGDLLAQELQEKYGYQVIHDKGIYDLRDGVLDRSASYDYARESVQQILAENPSIEVVIDLHRDGVEGQKFVTDIGGKPTSMVMFFNGISQNSYGQALSWLPNPYIEENLAFSLQMQLAAQEKYPGFTRNIYLKAERFNLHLRPRSLLIEAGTQLNTVEEERNAMIVLAELLNEVLS